MSQTVILDDVKYDLFRRILAARVLTGHGNAVATARILTGEAYAALVDAGVIAKHEATATAPPAAAVETEGLSAHLTAWRAGEADLL